MPQIGSRFSVRPKGTGLGQNSDGWLEVFARGSDYALYHLWQVAPSGGWVSLGGWIGNNPAVGQFADGRLAIFVQGTNSAPYLKWQSAPNGGWTDWVLLGGVRSGVTASGKSIDRRCRRVGK